jgi:cell division protein FtsQ
VPRPASTDAPARGASRDRGQDLVIADLDDEAYDDLDEDDGDDTAAPTAVDVRRRGPSVPSAPVRSLEPAYAAREKARRRVLLVRAGIAAGAVAVLAVVGWLALLSPVLALDAAEVNVVGGSDWVDPAAVVAVAAGQEGTPLLRVDTATVRDQVAAMPGVLEAGVERNLPRGLTITVVPREPVALVAQDAATVQLVGSDGVVIATTPVEQAPVGLPTLAVDMTTPGAGTAVNDVLAVLADLPPELLGQMASAGAAGPGDVRLELVGGAQVVWGSASDSALKAAVLQTLLQVGASTYDVSTPETPITS